MRLDEIASRKKKLPLRTYAAKVKLRQSGYTNMVDTTVQARSPEMARRLLRKQFGGRQAVVGQPRELG